MSDERKVIVDASSFITLADIGGLELLRATDGVCSMPQGVITEITSEPAASRLEGALGHWLYSEDLGKARKLSTDWDRQLRTAAQHLGRPSTPREWGGDVPLLAAALRYEACIVISDDKPVRQTCKALSVPVSGTIGLLVRAVERDQLAVAEAKSKLTAMDEVGARLSASLYRRAEQLLDEAAEA